MIWLKLGRGWRKIHDSTHVQNVIRITECMISIKIKLWFDSQAETKTWFFSSLFDSTQGILWFKSHIQNLKNSSSQQCFEIIIFSWLKSISMIVLFLKTRLIYLKHIVHTQTQTQTIWITHAKIWIEILILKDAQLKRTLKHKTKFKVNLNGQATKPHRE